eukprot:186111-Amphidinium_carterae.2
MTAASSALRGLENNLHVCMTLDVTLNLGDEQVANVKLCQCIMPLCVTINLNAPFKSHIAQGRAAISPRIAALSLS